ncbi:MAG: hypothetical protein ACE5J5_00480 [Candidatus Hydrothermarchaeales archaeon]
MGTEIDERLICQAEFYNHIIQYLDMLREQQPLRLTQRGNLPRKFCRELCDMDILEEDRVAFKNRPIIKEEDSYYIHLINLFTQLIGFTKKRHGTISLTKKCEKYLDKNSASELYLYLFSGYTRKFNWGYSDRYPESWIIQGGFGFSIFLLQKYGDKAREIKFYSDKYLRAFPSAIEEFSGTLYLGSEDEFRRCYYLRVFRRFLKRFGLIEIEEDPSFISANHTIIKKELLDQTIRWKIL